MVGRARGLLVVWEQTRREEETRLRRGNLAPMVRVLGQGRVATLDLLQEIATQNAVSTPGCIHPNPTVGRGRVFADPLNNSYSPSGLGGARVRNPGLCSFPKPPLCPCTHGPGVCVEVTSTHHPVPQIQMQTLHPELHLWSPSLTPNPQSWGMKPTQTRKILFCVFCVF